MQYFEATLVANTACGPGAYILRFSGCEALADSRPGQFVMLRGPWGTDPLLPRAFSILSALPGGEIEILSKAVGKATRLLEAAPSGGGYTMLGPLGSSFVAPAAGTDAWLIAGGVGIAPLLFFARDNPGRSRLFYGGRSQADLVLSDRIESLGIPTHSATDDGSFGLHGRVTEQLVVELDKHQGTAPTLLACGPEPMLVAVAKIARQRQLKAHLSLEGEMACGIGVCLGCAVPCVTRPFRYACVDGPVMDLAELAGDYA